MVCIRMSGNTASVPPASQKSELNPLYVQFEPMAMQPWSANQSSSCSSCSNIASPPTSAALAVGHCQGRPALLAALPLTTAQKMWKTPSSGRACLSDASVSGCIACILTQSPE